MYKELLWIFTQLPDNYIVLDTETTGLPDENGLPDIVTLGITVVRHREIATSTEFQIRPQKPISAQAQSIHGITNEPAAAFEPFELQWQRIAEYLKGQLIVIHNASFDWPILLDHVARYGLVMPQIQGVFCSQKAAIPWAQAMNFPCSNRGPSLDALTKALNIEDFREKIGGTHGAAIDSQQTALVVEAIRDQQSVSELSD
ncbi:MAG TPA: 3'-5' exonuclease [Candidatus Competibacteraceae bacterium]|nr:3'-5' exonuclease [Candidatus Competibacteraceae bacterium]